jgi:TetR/AcrR family transcriptional repressor of nem operon
MATRNKASDARTKGARTRQRIIERAATLFNTRGVAAASMSDVTAACELERGGVYNHFASKEELSLAAFDYAAALVLKRLVDAAEAQRDPLRKLGAMIAVYRNVAQSPLLPGGCPLLNAAIEADDTNPVLRNRVRKAMNGWRALLVRALEEALAAKQLVPLDPQAFASIVIASLEGGIMLSSLYRDPTHMHAVVDHLQSWITSLET